MSQRKARDARRQNPPLRQPPSTSSRRRRIGIGAISVVAGAALVVGVVVARNGSSPAQATPVVHSSSSGLSISGTDPVSGQRVSLASYAAKPIVLNVWGSWCPGCNDEATDLARFAATHPQAQVIGIDINDSKSGARSFYQRWRWKHPSIYDPRSDIAYRLGLQGTPTTYFLNRQHKIVAQVAGATNLAGFEQGLQKAIGSS